MSRGPYIRATKSSYQYPYMQYPYQNVGTQMTWRGSPPYNARGGDVRSMGSLPLPGAPESIPVQSGYSGTDCGCGCKGAGTCGMGADVPYQPPPPTEAKIVDLGSKVLEVAAMPGRTVAYAVTGKSPGTVPGLAVTAGLGYLLYRVLKKKRR